MRNWYDTFFRFWYYCINIYRLTDVFTLKFFGLIKELCNKCILIINASITLCSIYSEYEHNGWLQNVPTFLKFCFLHSKSLISQILDFIQINHLPLCLFITYHLLPTEHSNCLNAILIARPPNLHITPVLPWARSGFRWCPHSRAVSLRTLRRWLCPLVPEFYT